MTRKGCSTWLDHLIDRWSVTLLSLGRQKLRIPRTYQAILMIEPTLTLHKEEQNCRSCPNAAPPRIPSERSHRRSHLCIAVAAPDFVLRIRSRPEDSNMNSIKEGSNCTILKEFRFSVLFFFVFRGPLYHHPHYMRRKLLISDSLRRVRAPFRTGGRVINSRLPWRWSPSRLEDYDLQIQI